MNRYSVDQLTEMARGFQAASILIAAAELDVFTILDAAPVAGEELARRLSADARASVVLLDALASMDLLEKRDGGYSVPADLVPILTEAGESSILGTLRHQGNCMRCWGQLAKVVLTGRPCREESVRGSAADIESFIRAMNEISGRIAAALVKSIGPLQFTHLLDIGGASGTWTILFLQLYPGAKATIFDLPEVISMAAGVAAAPGMAGRIRLAAGDYNTDEFPPGADLAWVSAIVHQNSRDQNRGLFRKVIAALAPGGQMLIRDIVMDESRTTPVAGAFFAVNMLVATPDGGTFTFNELGEDLSSAGFTDIRLLREGEIMDSVVSARKP
jgi:precorrin-6B methylase 2